MPLQVPPPVLLWMLISPLLMRLGPPRRPLLLRQLRQRTRAQRAQALLPLTLPRTLSAATPPMPLRTPLREPLCALVLPLLGALLLCLAMRRRPRLAQQGSSTRS